MRIFDSEFLLEQAHRSLAVARLLLRTSAKAERGPNGFLRASRVH